MSSFLNTGELKGFKEIVDVYRPSKDVIDKFINSDFAVIAGPAVAGKDTLREELLRRHPDVYRKILSTTTRPKRKSEGKNKAYNFVSNETMTELINDRQLLQAALVHNQQVSAVQSSEVDKLTKGKIGLSILIVQAEKQLHKINPGVKTIFLIPPTLDEMIRRLKSARAITEAEINRRLAAAKEETKIALNVSRYQCIATDRQENVEKTAHEFLTSARIVEAEDSKARKIMLSILEQL